MEAFNTAGRHWTCEPVHAATVTAWVLPLVWQCCGVQVLQQPDERVPGGKTASLHALEKLAVKYCTKRGGGARTSVQVGMTAGPPASHWGHIRTSEGGCVRASLCVAALANRSTEEPEAHAGCAQVEAEMMAHIAAAEKKSNILERQLNQVIGWQQRPRFLTLKQSLPVGTALGIGTSGLQHSQACLFSNLLAHNVLTA